MEMLNTDRNNEQKGSRVVLTSNNTSHGTDGWEDPAMLLPRRRYQAWRRALETDDHVAVRETLQQAQGIERQRLLNGRFERAPEDAETLRTLNRVTDVKALCEVDVRSPWMLAAACGSTRAMSALHAAGVDVLGARDERGDNVLHMLVYLSFLAEDFEPAAAAVYSHLRELLTLDELSRSLKQEGRHGLYPVEMAAWLSTFTLFIHMVETEGVYRHREVVDSVFHLDMYDVTEYETPSARRFHSPVLFLLSISDDQVPKKDSHEVFDSNLLNEWVSLKQQAVMPWMVTWCLVRLVFLVVYTFYDNSGGWTNPPVKGTGDVGSALNNTTTTILTAVSCEDHVVLSENYHIYVTLSFYIMLHSLCSLLSDLSDIVFVTCSSVRHLLLKAFKTPRGWKNLAVIYSFYRLTQLFLALTAFIGASSSIAMSVGGSVVDKTVLNYLYLIANFCVIWSVLFFCQLWPFLGYFIISVQSMITELSKFFLIYMAFSLPYALLFQRLVNEGYTAPACPQEFSTVFESLYSTFTAMINMVNFRSYHVTDPTALYLLHMTFVFIIPILLLNFLVALFSSSLTRVDDNRNVLQMIQWLSVVCTLEMRIATFFSRLHQRRVRQMFVCKDGRIFVPVLSIKTPSKDSSSCGKAARSQSSTKCNIET